MNKKVYVSIFIISWMLFLQACKNDINIDMVFVEGGTFMMGSEDHESDSDEKPLHQVQLSDFYIGKYEVTQAEWTSVMKYNPSNIKGDKRPVECVSWFQVQIFISKLSTKTGRYYRLPTEAEWEYAARGGSKSKGYKYSGSNELDKVAWFYDNCEHQTHPVGTKAPNELGIYDMSGNVHEWCSGHYDNLYYSKSPLINPQGAETGEFLVFRGGSWYSDEIYCRIANRNYNSAELKNFSLGFRLVENIN